MADPVVLCFKDAVSFFQLQTHIALDSCISAIDQRRHTSSDESLANRCCFEKRMLHLSCTLLVCTCMHVRLIRLLIHSLCPMTSLVKSCFHSHYQNSPGFLLILNLSLFFPPSLFLGPGKNSMLSTFCNVVFLLVNVCLIAGRISSSLL